MHEELEVLDDSHLRTEGMSWEGSLAHEASQDFDRPQSKKEGADVSERPRVEVLEHDDLHGVEEDVLRGLACESVRDDISMSRTPQRHTPLSA